MVLELTKEDDWYIKGAKFGKANALPEKRILGLFNIMKYAWKGLIRNGYGKFRNEK